MTIIRPKKITTDTSDHQGRKDVSFLSVVIGMLTEQGTPSTVSALIMFIGSTDRVDLHNGHRK